MWPEQALSTGGDHTPLCDLFANCTKACHQPQAPAFLESGLVNSRKALRGVTVREVEIRSLGSQPWPLAGCGILNKSLYLLNFRFIICHKCQYKQNRVMISAEDVGMWPRCWGPSESTGSPGWGAVPSFWLGCSRRAGSIQACLPASHCSKGSALAPTCSWAYLLHTQLCDGSHCPLTSGRHPPRARC